MSVKEIRITIMLWGSWSIVFGIAIGYELDDRWVRVRAMVGSHQAFYPMGMWGLLP
jgi:hypothetical protein